MCNSFSQIALETILLHLRNRKHFPCFYRVIVLTSSNLTWTKHVDQQCTKATRMLGYVRRSTLNIQSMVVRRVLYLTLVRSQLCYGSQVWAPQSVTMIKCTERVQRRATKYILDLPFRTDTSYKQRLLLLNLLPLCFWHEFLDMHGAIF